MTWRSTQIWMGRLVIQIRMNVLSPNQRKLVVVELATTTVAAIKLTRSLIKLRQRAGSLPKKTITINTI